MRTLFVCKCDLPAQFPLGARDSSPLFGAAQLWYKCSELDLGASAVKFDFGFWIGTVFPIVVGVVTALVLAWYAERNKPGA